MVVPTAAEIHGDEEAGALWKPISLAKTLRDAPCSRPARILLLLWLGATLMCIGLGVYQVNMGWNGIPVHLGPIRFSMTIYTPLIICLWMLFWFGFEGSFIA